MKIKSTVWQVLAAGSFGAGLLYALANVTAMRDDFIKDRDDFKEHFQKWKSLYGGACDRLRRAENLVQQAQGELNSRIDQLSIVAFGLPGFDEIMQTAMEIALPDKKEE